MKKITIQLIGFVIIVCSIGAAWYVFFKPASSTYTSDTTTASDQSFPALPDNISQQAPDITAITGDTSSALKAIADQEAAAPFTKTFSDAKLHLSFRYSDAFTVKEVPEGGAIIITVVDLRHNVGVQIEARPFADTNLDITPARVKSEIPDLVVKNPETISFGPNHHGAVFISEQGDQTTREIWFAENGFLYQMSSPIESESVLKTIFNTLKPI